MGIESLQMGSGAFKTLVLVALSIILISFVIGPLTIAEAKEDANDSITIDVNITPSAAIEVLPSSISWVQIIPGSNGTASEPDDIENISIKNIGSYNLTDFYFDLNTIYIETTNPVASGQASDYAAGGLMLFRNETATERYYHAGRLEWNLSEIMDGEILDYSAGVVNFSHGWYRLASGNEFLWKVENGTCGAAAGFGAGTGICNCTDTNLVISNFPENSTGFSRDLSSNIATAPTPQATNLNWSLFHYNSTQGGPLEGHCVAVHWSCEKIYVYKYDKTGTGSSGFGDCREARYIAAEQLEPGERLDKFKIKPSVPYGTPAGDARTTTMIFYTSINYTS